MPRRNLGLILCTAALLLPVGGSLAGQEAAGGADADALARELSNPVGALASLTFQGTYGLFDGSLEDAGDQHSSSLIFLPTLPFKLWGGNLTVRPSFPFMRAPTHTETEGWDRTSGLGDIGLMAIWGRMEENGLLWGLGPTAFFPTAKGDLGAGQYQLGPAGLVGLLKEWGVVGALWQHWWGLNPNEGEASTNLATLQIFYWFSVGGGWQIGGSPTPSATYVTAQDVEFSVPLNLGFAKTLTIGQTPLKVSVQGQYFVTRPETFGPNWGVFFSVAPVVKVPW